MSSSLVPSLFDLVNGFQSVDYMPTRSWDGTPPRDRGFTDESSWCGWVY